MDPRQKILDIVRNVGPVTPTHIAKELHVESYVASAMLSELVSSKLLKISNLKVGSTPLYFLRGQEPLLENYIKNLNEKDRRTCALLKEKKIIVDVEEDPLTRVSLRSIKDFAMPLEVTYDGETKIFWKWHTLPAQETEQIIKSVIDSKKKQEQRKIEEPEEKKQKKEEQAVDRQIEATAEDRKAERPKDHFIKKVSDYFKKNSIVVLQEDYTRKNNLEFVIRLPTAVGDLNYYCNAVDKKRISEGDLAAAYVKGENKKLPTIILTPGDLTKGAKEALEKDFKKVAVKKL